jgi:hypothetical protein
MKEGRSNDVDRNAGSRNESDERGSDGTGLNV